MPDAQHPRIFLSYARSDLDDALDAQRIAHQPGQHPSPLLEHAFGGLVSLAVEMVLVPVGDGLTLARNVCEAVRP